MKRFTLASFVAMFLIPVICHAENWQKYFTTYTSKSNIIMSYECFYDTHSVNYIGKNIVRVWYKNGNISFSQNGTPLTLSGGGFPTTTELKEFDCPQRRYKILSGKMIDENEIRSLPESEAWHYPMPGDEDEALYNIVCKSK